jgi:chaperonin GroES
MPVVEKLISFIGHDNVAEIIVEEEDGENTLSLLAAQVIEDYARDLDSMHEWSDAVDNGKMTAKQEYHARSEPWQGASNFKTPAITEASLNFGDRASTELLRGRNLIKMDVIGKDSEGAKRKKANNASEFMNWQINHQMKDWRKKQENLLYELPATGTVFKKTYYDKIMGRIRSEILHYPDFAVNQATEDIDEALSFTQPMAISRNTVIERKAAGLWLDVEIYPVTSAGEEQDGKTGSNSDEDVIDATDNPQKFLEQNCFYDLDGDGYQEPYIVTVHESTRQVVRIVARFDIGDILVSNEDELVTGDITRALTIADSGKGLELVRITPIQNITKYGFIRNPDGSFLDIGYYHLLGGLSKAINSTTNQLLDSGSLSNLQGGMLAKGYRKRMGNLKTKPGEWHETNISAADLHNGIMPHQFKEPSVVLLTLNEKLNTEVDQLSVNTDLKGVLSPNAPATTTLALIQEATLPMSAVMQRLTRAESEEFTKIYMLDSVHIDNDLYQKVLDDQEANFENDFDADSMDVMPTANSEMSSRMQRIQLAEILISQAQVLALAGGDVRPIYEFWFDAIGAIEVQNQVFPDPNTVSEEQKARMEQQEKDTRNQMMLQAIQVDHAEREIERKESETKAKLIEAPSKARNLESDTVLNLEKAETEQTKNKISTYTAQLQGIREAIDNTLKGLSIEESEANETAVNSEVAGRQATQPNIQI